MTAAFPRMRALALAAATGIILAAGPVRAQDTPVSDARAFQIVTARCVACHSVKPTLRASAPKGLVLDSEADLRAHAAGVADTVAGDEMPPRNATKMTEAERDEIARWFKTTGK